MSKNLIALSYEGFTVSYYMEVNPDETEFHFTPALSNHLIPGPEEPFPSFTVFHTGDAFNCVGTRDKQLISGAIQEVRLYLSGSLNDK
jgi:hypothetical protein